MRMLAFGKRNTKEILRDPVTLIFGLAFPLILLGLFSIINAAIPAEANNTMFEPTHMAPGVAMVGNCFMAMFSGLLLAKDRTSSFLMRLFTSPMSAADFLLGYTLPMLAMAMAQSLITLLVAVFLGLPFSMNILVAVLTLIPIAIIFIGIGLLCGSVMNDKAVGGICGALLTNVAGFFSGVWIPIDMIGGAFLAVSKALPFFHAAEAARRAIAGDFGAIWPHLGIVCAYALVIYVAAVVVFGRKMHGDK